MLSLETNLIWKDAEGKVPKKTKVSGIKGVTSRGNIITDKRILQKNLNEATKETGRYHLTVQWNKRSGHIFTAERLNDGTLQIYDPQTGSTECWDRYLKYLDAKYGIGLQRVDGLFVNLDIVDGVVHKP